MHCSYIFLLSRLQLDIVTSIYGVLYLGPDIKSSRCSFPFSFATIHYTLHHLSFPWQLHHLLRSFSKVRCSTHKWFNHTSSGIIERQIRNRGLRGKLIHRVMTENVLPWRHRETPRLLTAGNKRRKIVRFSSLKWYPTTIWNKSGQQRNFWLEKIKQVKDKLRFRHYWHLR